MDAPIAQNRAFTWFVGVGRLKSGVTIAKAISDLNGVQTRLGRQFPQTDKDLSVEIQPLKETIVAGARRSLWILFGSVTLLLLIACTNIAALLLSQITERSREISIRYSLGAARSSIIVQLMTEAFVLALLGSVCGLAVASGAVRVFQSLAKALPRAGEIALDWRLAGYTLCCAGLATLLCGLVPALVASRRSISSRLAEHGRGHVSSGTSLQWTLVGMQVALAVTLLIGAGLLVRSLKQLSRVSPGFDPDHVLTLRISGNYGETTDQGKMHQRMKQTIDTLAAVSGVESTAISATVPGTARGFPMDIKLADAAVPSDRKVTADEKVVYGAYFETLHIPLLRGSTCRQDALWTNAVVNRSFAQRYFPNQNPIGHHLEITAVDIKPAIVGIVGDARENGLNNAPVPTVYWCSSNANPSPYFLIRTHGDPMTLANALRREIHRIEPERSVFEVRPLLDRFAENNAENRFRTLLLTLFALTAISLAALGLYGTLSYLVAVRNREIGLRMALGAVPRQIRTRFLAQGAGVSLIGCLAGLAIAVILSPILTGMLYDVSRLDPLTYLAVTLGVLAVASVASVFPASRAARLDPMEVLRHE